MRISFEKIRKKTGSLVSMTSLREAEFIDLAACFEIEFEKYLRVYTLQGKKRDRPVINPRKNSTFPNAEDKLLFILMYLKTYPLQAVVAAQYGMSQPQVNRWITLLRAILLETLNRKSCFAHKRHRRASGDAGGRNRSLSRCYRKGDFVSGGI